MPFTEQPQPDEDEVALSRRASPIGKLLDELKTYADQETASAFRMHCAKHDTDTSRLLRNYVYFVVHGKTFDELEAAAEKELMDRRRGAFLMPASIEGVNQVSSGSVAQGARQ